MHVINLNTHTHKYVHALHKEIQTHRNASNMLQRCAWKEEKSEDGQWG